MKRKITAIVCTLLFIVEQLLIPKVAPMYFEWVGGEDIFDFPALFALAFFTLIGQAALVFYLWMRAFLDEMK